jgi:hypothetical protein
MKVLGSIGVSPFFRLGGAQIFLASFSVCREIFSGIYSVGAVNFF